MTLHKTPELLGICLTLAVACSTFSMKAVSATAADPSAAESRYRQDRANCLAGKTNEDRKTCLREAGAALQAARKHELKNGSAAQLADNERKRCEPLTGDDRKACLARADGMGATTGSVAAGGELHELVTVTPGVQPESAPPTAAGATPLPPAQGQ
jgi:hypothetical protein